MILEMPALKNIMFEDFILVEYMKHIHIKDKNLKENVNLEKE